MKLAVFFAVHSFLFLLLLLYYLDILLFYLFEKRAFDQKHKSKAYLQKLEERHKKAISKRKKNFLLFLICDCLAKQGEEKKAKELFLFVKKDFLLGIKKEADH